MVGFADLSSVVLLAYEEPVQHTLVIKRPKDQSPILIERERRDPADPEAVSEATIHEFSVHRGDRLDADARWQRDGRRESAWPADLRTARDHGLRKSRVSHSNRRHLLYNRTALTAAPTRPGSVRDYSQPRGLSQ